MRLVEPLDYLVGQKKHQMLEPLVWSGVKYVPRHEEAPAGGGSFAQQGGIFA